MAEATTKAPAKKKAVKKPKAAAKPKATGRKVPVYGVDGKKKGDVSIPKVFETEMRPDLVRRAVTSAEANKRQVYGPNPLAGMQHSTEWPGKGRGMARTPRLRGGKGAGAEAPNTVGGRRAHPPHLNKDYTKKINRKEARAAKFSALAATGLKDMVSNRGHKFEDKLKFPLIIENGVDDVNATKDALSMLETMGLMADIERARDGRHIRAGKGKARGRKYRQPRSLLLVIAPKEGDTTKSKARGFRNLLGVEVVSVNTVGTPHLAPGGDMGRLVVYSERAIETIERWS